MTVTIKYDVVTIEEKNYLQMIFAEYVMLLPMETIVMHFFAEYEILERSVVTRLYDKGDKVLEAGTGTGFVTAIIAKTGADVFTCDPIQANLDVANLTLRLNKLESNVSISCAALGPIDGEADFYVHNLPYASSFYPIDADPEAMEKITVPVMGVNEVLAEVGANGLHMDIEGGEIALLRVLDFGLINKLSFECHPSIIGDDTFWDELLPLIEANGFQVVAEAGWFANYPTHNYVVGFERKGHGTEEITHEILDDKRTKSKQCDCDNWGKPGVGQQSNDGVDPEEDEPGNRPTQDT